MEKHYCINCGAEATMLHHVVPKKLGGNDTTNCVWLCDKCHGLIHGIKYGNGQLSQNELVKQGLARARAEGKRPGRPPAKITKDYIKNFIAWKRGEITATEAAKRSNIAKATFYKLAHKIENESDMFDFPKKL